MKLSEAIREGARIRPQGFMYSFSKNEQGEICSCAWGAAQEAIFGFPFMEDISGAVMYKTHPKECATFIENPVTGQRYDLPSVITDLNDASRWTREQIANWLEKKGF